MSESPDGFILPFFLAILYGWNAVVVKRFIPRLTHTVLKSLLTIWQPVSVNRYADILYGITRALKKASATLYVVIHEVRKPRVSFK